VSNQTHEILHLTKKVIEEFRDPLQFRDIHRTLDLVLKGKTTLYTILKRKRTDLLQLAEKAEGTLQMIDLESGVKLAICESDPHFGALIFPPNTSVDISFATTHYQRHTLLASKADCDYIASMPVYEMNYSSNLYVPAYGIISSDRFHRFKKFDAPAETNSKKKILPNEKLAHGGIYYHPETGIEFVDYDQMMAKYEEISQTADTEFHSTTGETLIQAQWYLDSEQLLDTLTQTSLKKNAQPFNALGVLILPTGEKIFLAINSAFESFYYFFKNYFQVDSSFKTYPTLESISALMNVLAKRNGAVGWQLVGLDYNGGGTVPTDRILDGLGSDAQIYEAAGRFRIRLPKVVDPINSPTEQMSQSGESVDT
jgi:hypothetical protein